MRESVKAEVEVIKKHQWIMGMGNGYLTKWTELVNKYAEELNGIPIKRETGYTHHDFSHHCKDIYKIIENVFLCDVKIEEEEYFVLAVAVLLHDISMTKIHFDRLVHSQQSVEYIEREIEDGEGIWSKIDPQTIEAIKQVIRAHSDIKEKDKEGKEKVKIYTLRDTEMTMDGEAVTLHVRWLAGILRLADELDITVARKGVADNRYQELLDEDSDESYSKRCWRQLNYFESVKKDKTVIKLVLYTPYLKNHLNDDRANIVSEIKKIRGKICERLSEANEYAFNEDEEYMRYIKIIDVKVDDKGIGLSESELEEDLGKENESEEESLVYDDSSEDEVGIGFSLDEEEFIVDKEKGIDSRRGDKKDDNASESEREGQDKPLHLRENLGKGITEFVYANDLIDYGHYRLNRRLCAEKWIDVRAVLSDVNMSRKITKIISRDLKAYLEKKRIAVKDILLIGVSVNGNIIASRVAFLLGAAFTYIVPTKPGICGTDMEKEARIDRAKKIILFTGAISSYDTIARVIKDYCIETELLRIYTVFWREIEKKYQMLGSFEKIKKSIERKVIFLNNDFQCEVLESEKCIQKKYGNCIARNRKAYDEVYDWPLAVKDNNSNRIFINNMTGCDSACQYCYLQNIGIQQINKYSNEEVIAEFERLYDVTPQKCIISFGCYTECMRENNLSEMEQLIQYFADRGYYMQISTKKEIDHEWLRKMESYLCKESQLNIYVSMPTLSQANVIEPNAVCVNNRIKNFDFCSETGKIEMYMYIKPFLEDITIKDIEDYVKLQTKYKMKIIIGNRFRFDLKVGECVWVGKIEMYEKKFGSENRVYEAFDADGKSILS